MTETLARPAGRPRDASRDAALLQATLDLLVEVGYDRLTIDAVAARVKASKATVYRRWPNKAALVVDAVHALHQAKDEAEGGNQIFPDTGSLREDLLAGARGFVQKLTGEDGRLIAAVMTASMRDPELAAAMRAGTDDKAVMCAAPLDRALARGELATACAPSVLGEVVQSVFMFRFLVSGEPLDEEFVVHVVDDIVLPLLQGSRCGDS
ncbi:MAG TPA: TetR/AcrR family transcriptional regulator [Mycobacteriales bacterium]|nr:TetR/AcrR family transcriptional regulator [Mycobacteriales bacterium]